MASAAAAVSAYVPVQLLHVRVVPHDAMMERAPQRLAAYIRWAQEKKRERVEAGAMRTTESSVAESLVEQIYVQSMDYSGTHSWYQSKHKSEHSVTLQDYIHVLDNMYGEQEVRITYRGARILNRQALDKAFDKNNEFVGDTLVHAESGLVLDKSVHEAAGTGDAFEWFGDDGVRVVTVRARWPCLSPALVYSVVVGVPPSAVQSLVLPGIATRPTLHDMFGGGNSMPTAVEVASARARALAEATTKPGSRSQALLDCLHNLQMPCLYAYTPRFSTQASLGAVAIVPQPEVTVDDVAIALCETALGDEELLGNGVQAPPPSSTTTAPTRGRSGGSVASLSTLVAASSSSSSSTSSFQVTSLHTARAARARIVVMQCFSEEARRGVVVSRSQVTSSGWSAPTTMIRDLLAECLSTMNSQRLAQLDPMSTASFCILAMHESVRTLRMLYDADPSTPALFTACGTGVVRTMAELAQRQPHVLCFASVARYFLYSRLHYEWTSIDDAPNALKDVILRESARRLRQASETVIVASQPLQVPPVSVRAAVAVMTEIPYQHFCRLAHEQVQQLHAAAARWQKATTETTIEETGYELKFYAEPISVQLIDPIVYTLTCELLTTHAFFQQMSPDARVDISDDRALASLFWRATTTLLIWRCACAIYHFWLKANQFGSSASADGSGGGGGGGGGGFDESAMTTSGHVYSLHIAEAAEQLVKNDALMPHPITQWARQRGPEASADWLHRVTCASMLWLHYMAVARIEPDAPDMTMQKIFHKMVLRRKEKTADAVRVDEEPVCAERCDTTAGEASGLLEDNLKTLKQTSARFYTHRAASVENTLALTLADVVMGARRHPSSSPPPTTTTDDFAWALRARLDVRHAMVAAYDAAARPPSAEDTEGAPSAANALMEENIKLRALVKAHRAYRERLQQWTTALATERAHLLRPSTYTRTGYAGLPSFDKVFERAESVATALLVPGGRLPATIRVKGLRQSVQLVGGMSDFPHRLALQMGRATPLVARLDDFQRQAFECACQSVLTVISGAGGTGKTETLRAILTAFGPGQTLVVAPTGRGSVVSRSRLATLTREVADFAHSVISVHTLHKAMQLHRRTINMRRLAAMEPKHLTTGGTKRERREAEADGGNGDDGNDDEEEEELGTGDASDITYSAYENIYKACTAESPLDQCVALVVDETTLADAATLQLLLDMMHTARDEVRGTRYLEKLVVLGDFNQLEPVGWGQPFLDLKQVAEHLGTLCVLQTNHRSEGRAIATNAARLAAFHNVKAPAKRGRLRFDLSASTEFMVHTPDLVLGTRTTSANVTGQNAAETNRLLRDGVVDFIQRTGYRDALATALTPDVNAVTVPSVHLIAHTNETAREMNRIIREACFGAESPHAATACVFVGDKFYFRRNAHRDLTRWFDSGARAEVRALKRGLARQTTTTSSSSNADGDVEPDGNATTTTTTFAHSRYLLLSNGEILRVVRFYDRLPPRMERLCRCRLCPGAPTNDASQIDCLDPTCVPPRRRVPQEDDVRSSTWRSAEQQQAASERHRRAGRTGEAAVYVPPERVVVYLDELGMLREMPAREAFGRRNVFEFGHATTVHKAQGSEWDSVYFAVMSRSPHVHWKFCYTALTRARKRMEVLSPKISWTGRYTTLADEDEDREHADQTLLASVHDMAGCAANPLFGTPFWSTCTRSAPTRRSALADKTIALFKLYEQYLLPSSSSTTTTIHSTSP